MMMTMVLIIMRSGLVLIIDDGELDKGHSPCCQPRGGLSSLFDEVSSS